MLSLLLCSHLDSDGKNTPTAGEARVYIMCITHDNTNIIISHDIILHMSGAASASASRTPARTFDFYYFTSRCGFQGRITI